LLGVQLFGQSLSDMSFGEDNTLEVVTWNIEWFPKQGQTTVDSVIQIIRALDVDVLALQEISDTLKFKQMLNSLEGYEGSIESTWFAGLAYVYKTATVEIQDIYEIYYTDPYWNAFPRSPLVMEMRFKGEDFVIINNHFKCCGDGILDLSYVGDEETRRYYASNLLKQYIDSNFPDENVILLGDLNDILTDDPEHNVFQVFLDDSDRYYFADMEIAMGSSSGWSYPGWPSHLDHILVTNELFEEIGDGSSVIQTLKIGNYLPGGFWEYDQKISDHRPVAMKIQTGLNSAIREEVVQRQTLKVFPNPSWGETLFMFEPVTENAVLSIHNVNGQEIKRVDLRKGENLISWNVSELPVGMYYIYLYTGSRIVARNKLVVTK